MITDYEDEDEDEDDSEQLLPVLDGCVSCGTEWTQDTGPIVCHQCLMSILMLKHKPVP